MVRLGACKLGSVEGGRWVLAPPRRARHASPLRECWLRRNDGSLRGDYYEAGYSVLYG
jgi:hypothetical protein